MEAREGRRATGPKEARGITKVITKAAIRADAKEATEAAKEATAAKADMETVAREVSGKIVVDACRMVAPQADARRGCKVVAKEPC